MNVKLKTKKAKPQLKTQNFKFYLVVFTFYFLSRMKLLLKMRFGIPMGFFVVMLFSGLFSFSCFAETTKIDDLINNNKKYNGEKVTIEGEAIGHLMRRGDFAWLNINDKANAIGVWAEHNIFDKVKFLGKHAVVGDWIRISGIFNSNCSMHGGDTDIHAEQVKILNNGNVRDLSHHPQKVKFLIFLTAILICLYIIKILKRMRSRSGSQ